MNVRRLELLYLLMSALTIDLGLRYPGALLIGALIIIPAVAAKRLARNLGQMALLRVLFAALPPWSAQPWLPGSSSRAVRSSSWLRPWASR